MKTGATLVLDVKGLSCPLPILKAAKAMKQLLPGDLLEVIATDPGSVPDFQAWCRSTGNSLLGSDLENGAYRFVIEKG